MLRTLRRVGLTKKLGERSLVFFSSAARLRRCLQGAGGQGAGAGVRGQPRRDGGAVANPLVRERGSVPERAPSMIGRAGASPQLRQRGGRRAGGSRCQGGGRAARGLTGPAATCRPRPQSPPG
jgi:hypothetical protein